MNRTLPLVLAVALFMENMDSTVISTSLPEIARDLDTSPIALKLALAAYLVALAIFIPVSGWMSDRFGAKKVFRAAIAVFVVGSLLCAISNSLGAFVFSRFVQGMGGAMMTPIARLVLVRATAKSDLVSAMAWLTIPALLGPLVGPPLGGFITTYFSWHWIFIINVPIGLAGILISGWVLPDIDTQPRRRLDLIGFLLVAMAASGVVFGLSVISLPALPPAVGITTTIVGLAAGVAYIFHARRVAAPMLDLSLFSNATFRAAVAGASLFRLGHGAVPFLLPLLFQLVFGLTPFQSGMLTFVSAIGALTMKFMASSTLRRAGFRTVTAFTALAAGVLMCANAFFTQDTPYALIIVVLLAAGFMRSLFFTSTNTLVFADIDDRDAAQATAMAAAAQQISMALGVAFAGGLLELTALFTGGELERTGFVVAFLVTGIVSGFSAIFYFRLPRDAGSSISGHRGPVPADDKPELQN